MDGDGNISENRGEILLSGQVACNVWMHTKNTIEDVRQAALQDIVRSLAARLELHCDSLTEEEHGSPEGT